MFVHLFGVEICNQKGNVITLKKKEKDKNKQNILHLDIPERRKYSLRLDNRYYTYSQQKKKRGW